MKKFFLSLLVILCFFVTSCNKNENSYLKEYVEKNEENPETFELISKEIDTVLVKTFLETENFSIQRDINEIKKEVKKTQNRLVSIHLSSRTPSQKKDANENVKKQVSFLEKKIDSLENEKKVLKDEKTKNEIFYIGILYNYFVNNDKNDKVKKQYIVIEDKEGAILYKGVKPSPQKISNKFSQTYL